MNDDDDTTDPPPFPALEPRMPSLRDHLIQLGLLIPGNPPHRDTSPVRQSPRLRPLRPR